MINEKLIVFFVFVPAITGIILLFIGEINNIKWVPYLSISLIGLTLLIIIIGVFMSLVAWGKS